MRALKALLLASSLSVFLLLAACSGTSGYREEASLSRDTPALPSGHGQAAAGREPAATSPAPVSARTGTGTGRQLPVSALRRAFVPGHSALDPFLLGDKPPEDVWTRIRRQQQLLRHTSRPSVRREIAWLQDRPDYLATVTARATPYIHHIVESIEARGMPIDLALLPVVESAFKPTAYSRSHASGLWQFIPSTGRRYGLVQNEWYDGRRDVLEATRAALDYLEFLHATFNDWYHALAAYNAGEQAVLRAIARRQKQGKPFDFWSLRLPRETQAYVPKLLAVAEVIAWPEHYGLSLTPVPNQSHFEKVAVNGHTSLREAAQIAGVPLETLRALNPGFRKLYMNGKTPGHLLLPKDVAGGFAKRLAEHRQLAERKAVAARQAVAEASGAYDRHRIQPGETLAVIATRYATSVAVLQHINGLQTDLIYSGRTLLVPQVRQLAGDDGSWRSHTVRHGDTLWEISRSYGVSVRELLEWNDIGSDAVLQPGQELAVWSATDA